MQVIAFVLSPACPSFSLSLIATGNQNYKHPVPYSEWITLNIKETKREREYNTLTIKNHPVFEYLQNILILQIGTTVQYQDHSYLLQMYFPWVADLEIFLFKKKLFPFNRVSYALIHSFLKSYFLQLFLFLKKNFTPLPRLHTTHTI